MLTPFKGVDIALTRTNKQADCLGLGSTYCFTAVSVSVSVSVSVWSHPKAPPAQFFGGCTKI